MLGYVTIGVTDMEKAKAYYTDLLADFNAKLLFDGGRIAFIGEGWDKTMLAICIPFDENDPQPGNGNMLSFACDSPEMVDKLYTKALEQGSLCEGPPGQRLPIFYGAYFRDPDGNKSCFYHMNMDG